MQRRAWLCQTLTGATVPACSITVYVSGTTTKATIYSDQAGSSALANPISAGTDGTYTYYAPSGRYTEVVTAPGFTFGAAQTQDFILHDPFAAPGVSPNIFATTTWLNATPVCTNIPSPTVGKTFCFDQTANTLKSWDGTRWTTASATTVNNVKDFGATGLGVADDAPAIQLALTACKSAGGGTVYAPPGTYMLGSGQAGPASSTIALLISSNCALVGAGIDATIFKVMSTATSLTPIATTTGLGVTNNITLRDFTVDGNKANVTAGSGATNEGPQSNLYMDQVDTLLIDHVKSQNAVNSGIYSVNSSTHVTIRGSLFLNNGKNTGNGARGIAVNVTPTLYQIVDNVIAGSFNQGILFQNEGGADSADNVIAGNIIQANGVNGLDITDNNINSGTGSNRLSHRLTIAHNVIQGNTQNGLRISMNTVANGGGFVAVAQNIQVTGNVIDGNTLSGVLLSTSNGGLIKNVSIVGNQIRNNTTTGITVAAAAVTDTFIDGNLIAGNGTFAVTDSGTRTIQGVNKTDLTSTATFLGPSALVGFDGTTFFSNAGISVFGTTARTTLGEAFRFRVGTNQNLTARSNGGMVTLETVDDGASGDVGLALSAASTAITNGGLVLGAPPGGSKGTGTVNATDYYRNGTLIATMSLTNASGTATNAPHIVQDTVTLSGGTAGVALAGAAAFTSATSYTCVADDDTAIAAVKIVQNGGNGFTVLGTGSDVVRFICVGS